MAGNNKRKNEQHEKEAQRVRQEFQNEIGAMAFQLMDMLPPGVSFVFKRTQGKIIQLHQGLSTGTADLIITRPGRVMNVELKAAPQGEKPPESPDPGTEQSDG